LTPARNPQRASWSFDARAGSYWRWSKDEKLLYTQVLERLASTKGVKQVLAKCSGLPMFVNPATLGRARPTWSRSGFPYRGPVCQVITALALAKPFAHRWGSYHLRQ